MVLARQAQLYRDDARKSGTLLTASEREELMKPYLPAPVRPNSPSSRHKARPIRTFIKSQFHILIFTLIHTFYSAYIRLRQAYHAVLHRVSAILYYHHRTPELIQKDVKTLARLPKHLSVILELQSEEQGGESLGVLLDNVAEISAWCASVGIPILSVYEKTGILKNYIPVTHRTIASKLHSYFGRRRPSLQVRAPHMPSFLNGDISEESSNSTDLGTSDAQQRVSYFTLNTDNSLGRPPFPTPPFLGRRPIYHGRSDEDASGNVTAREVDARRRLARSDRRRNK